MTIDFIRFKYGQNLSGGEKISIAGGNDLKELNAVGHPQVLITDENNVESLKSYHNLILDRGRKDFRRALTAYLVGKASGVIPLISADYTNINRLVCSIRNLLIKAVEKDENRSIIIAVSHQIFLALSRKIQNNSAARGPKLFDREAFRLCGNWENENNPPSGIREDLFDLEVPDDLKRSYLGNSSEFEMVRKMIICASTLKDVPVLIMGPPGSGKRKTAASIHERSRGEGKFITIDCGAVSGELLEAELFGLEKGSCGTAEKERCGLWEEAQGGTLFLYEVEDLLPEQQEKVLRALTEHEIQPLGGKEVKQANARVIAAANRELFPMVREGRFNADLYYGLRNFLIRTPPLTPLEVPYFADIFWQKISNTGPSLSDSFKHRLTHYAWPGNIRHLKSVLVQVYALFPGKEVDARHLDWVMSMDGCSPQINHAADVKH